MRAERVDDWLHALHGPPDVRGTSGHHERIARGFLQANLAAATASATNDSSDGVGGDDNGGGESDQVLAPLLDATADAGALARAAREDVELPTIKSLAPAALTFGQFLDLNVDVVNREPWSTMYDIHHLGAAPLLGPTAMSPPADGGLPFFSKVFDYLYYSGPAHFSLREVRRPLPLAT